MPTYYVRVMASLQDWIPGGAGPNWKAVLFSDITEEGTRVCYTPMSANERGPRIAVYGDRYMCWLGQDMHRRDTFFVMRVEQARMLRETPVNISATFRLWDGGEPPEGDSVAPFFGLTADTDAATPEVDAVVVPVERLTNHLSRWALSLAPAFRPGRRAAQPDDPLVGFRRIWRRFGLEHCLTLDTRRTRILNGLVTPQRLDETEYHYLSNQLSISALNHFAVQSGYADSLEPLLSELLTVSLDEHSRSLIWETLVAGLSVNDARTELDLALAGVLASSDSNGQMPGVHREVFSRVAERLSVEMPGSTYRELVDALRRDESVEHLVAAHPPRPNDVELVAEVPDSVSRVNDREAYWLLRLILPSVDSFAATLSDVAGQLNASHAQLLENPERVTAWLDSVMRSSRQLAQLAERLPGQAEVEGAVDRVRLTYRSAIKLMGTSATEALLKSHDLPARDFDDLLRLLGRVDILRQAPEWLVWLDQDPAFELGQASIAQMANLLAEPRRRQHLNAFLGYYDQIRNPKTLAWLQPPDTPERTEEVLREWFEGVRYLMDMLSQERLESLLNSDVGPSDVLRLRGLYDQLAPATADWLTAEYEKQNRATHEVWLQCVQQVLNEWAPVPLNLLTPEVFAYRLRLVEPEPTVAAVTTIGPERFGTYREYASLTLVRDNPDEDVAYVDLPLVIETSEPFEKALLVHWTVKSRFAQRNELPADFPENSPDRLMIRRFQWRLENSESSRFVYSFSARIWFRWLNTLPKSLEVSVRLTDAKTRQAVIPETNLSWTSLTADVPQLVMTWPSVGDPAYVTSHPVGAQLQASAIVGKLEGFANVAVLAPRRFGKTTLAKYLEQQLTDRRLLPLGRITCTEHMAQGRLNYSSVWKAISECLRERLDVEFAVPGTDPLPARDAFDAARRQAHERGYRAIVILIDEAQLFFSGRDGHSVGSQLKARLEASWAIAGSGRVPLLFCFVGLPPLKERAGADLLGLLTPFLADSMDEEQLRPLVKSRAKELQTPLALRHELARASGNLHIVKILLERLVARANSERRYWVNMDDLAVVRNAVQSALIDGRDVGLAEYIRDPLNESDDVNVWNPMPALAVAAAVAATPATMTAAERVSSVLTQVNEWLATVGRGTDVRFSISRERIDELLQVLYDRGVVDGVRSVGSPFVQAWLKGIAERGVIDGGLQEALLRVGERSIQVPSGEAWPGAKRHVTSAVAKADGTIQVYREARTCEEWRERFDRYRTTHDQVVRIRNTSAVGAAGTLLPLIDTGRHAEDGSRVVQVYYWMQGEDLAQTIGRLEADVVVDIGRRLFGGIELLHGASVVHSSITPRHVVLGVSGAGSGPEHPVFIDYGFQWVGLTEAAQEDAEFIAPELVHAPWVGTPAGDVYALSATLLAALRSNSDREEPVREALRLGMATELEVRYSAAQMKAHLEQLAINFSIEDRKSQDWKSLKRRLGQVPTGIQSVLEKHRSSLVNLDKKSYETRAAHRVMAQVLVEIAEVQRLNVGQHLAMNPHEGLALLHTLRTSQSHADIRLGKGHREALARYNVLSAQQQRSLVRQGVEEIGRLCHVPAIVELFRANL